MKKQKFEYKFVYMPSHPKASTNGCVYEHVLVAEQKLGRYLTKDETVHHIDGNKKNNDPNNLMIFASNSDHVAYHGGHSVYEQDGIWYSLPVFLTCCYCKKTFEQKKWKRQWKNTYCSENCARQAVIEQRIKNLQHITKDKQPFSKDELIDLLLKFDGNFFQAAKSIGITDNALRHRCISRGLPIHSIDYKLCF